MQNWLEKIQKTTTLGELETIRIDIFGKKGFLTLEFIRLKEVAAEEKKDFAQSLNQQKQILTQALEAKKEELEDLLIRQQLLKDSIDATRFMPQSERGAFHPVAQTMDRVIRYFQQLNFSVEDGPLVEDDFHNFEALNLPKYHPARDMQDTFYFQDGGLLRTHTSPVQIRTMLQQKHPIKMISPGAVFRRDFDLTHTPMFHQVEGLVVDEQDKVSFANLKYILEEFLIYMFGDVKVRFRPSFFPFTEPSAEVDISCVFCAGKGCRICKHTTWLEVLGCGIVDQNVFNAVGYHNISGYAFGLGIERFAMLIHKIDDLRSLFESDLRLLGQLK